MSPFQTKCPYSFLSFPNNEHLSLVCYTEVNYTTILPKFVGPVSKLVMGKTAASRLLGQRELEMVMSEPLALLCTSTQYWHKINNKQQVRLPYCTSVWFMTVASVCSCYGDACVCISEENVVYYKLQMNTALELHLHSIHLSMKMIL